MVQIGDAASLTGVPAKLIRYYESAGLLSPSRRQGNGYRVFDERNLHELRFIKRARTLGFPIKQIDLLLGLWRNKKRSSRKVREMAVRHQEQVITRMEEHRTIIDVLGHLIASCKGDDRPECPILDDLGSPRSRP